LGDDMLALGRYDSLLSWLAPLPVEIWQSHPGLHLLKGDVLRLRNDFEGALEEYQQAETNYTRQMNRLGHALALRGQAQVYLDTIRPMKADSLLENALRLLEPQEYRSITASLLDQLAENRLNLGHPDQAQALHHEAQLLRAESDPGDLYLEARALLRTGQLAAGRKILEERAEQERQNAGSRPQRFHRETLMLLSLICVLQGDVETAESAAREGIRIGQRLQSGFVESVGLMRLGHPIQMASDQPWNANACRSALPIYEQSIEKSRPFKVMRVHVEPLWGLARATGYSGDLVSARAYAERALEIAGQAGDVWMGNLVRVALGSAFTLAGEAAEAQTWLEEAALRFEQVEDAYGWCATQIWLALNAWRVGRQEEAMTCVACLLPVVRQNGYISLLTRPTFIGLRDGQSFWPLLLEARRHGIEPVTITELLRDAGLEEVETHPGYTLWVRLFGPFTVWRGIELIRPAEWQREKARQLFQLLLLHRGQWLGREQIADRLWPESPGDAAVRDFKVALNALNKALEPERPQGSPAFFIARRENFYMLNPQAVIRLDGDEFERLAASEGLEGLRQALALGADEFLPDSLNEGWTQVERERLNRVWLSVGDRLCELLVATGNREEAIQVCQAMIRRDPTDEPAYRYLMEIYGTLGNRAQVQNIYNRYSATLREHLGIEPSGEMQALLQRMTRN